GLSVLYNISSMLAENQQTEASLRIAAIDQEIAARSPSANDRFYADLLCAKVRFAARDYGAAVRCADAGRVIQGAPQEYLTRLLVFRARGLARLGEGRQARAALQQLRQLASSRGDPALNDRIDAIEPEVLRAEGRTSEAYAALMAYHENSERNVLRHF